MDAQRRELLRRLRDVASAAMEEPSWLRPVSTQARSRDELGTPASGSQLTNVYHSAHTLQPWPGFGVMCLFVTIVYAIAWMLLDRRDA